MNKKFSTLMAGLLLATAFSASAAVPEKGKYTEFKLGTSALLVDPATNSLQMKAGWNSTGMPTGIPTLTQYKDALAQQWQVVSKKFDTNSGTPIYQFVNKVTGQYLAINLKTDNNGQSTAAAKINAAGNKDWCVDNSGRLYVYKNDSTYTLNNNLELIATKGAGVPAAAATFATGENTFAMNLTAEVLNALMGKDGKLYFNDANVTSGEKNIIADNKWKAYTAGAVSGSTDFFMARFNADSVTSVNKNPYLLMVDTATYAGSSHNKLMIDTLAITKSEAAIMKDPTSAWTAPGSYNSEKKTKFAHQIQAATWKGTYILGNDSIALQVVSLPTKELQPSVITNGNYVLGSAADMSTAIATAWPAGTVGALPPSGPYAKIMPVAMALTNWDIFAKGISPSENATQKLQLRNSKFDAAGNLGGTLTYADLLKDAKAELDAVADKTTTQYAENKAYYDAAVELASLERTYSDGLTAYYHTANATHTIVTVPAPRDVVLVQLSNTKVLTLGVAGTGVNDPKRPLIQAVSTKGGDAVIAGNGKVYFMQVAAEPAEDSGLRAATLKGKYLVDAAVADSKIFDKDNLADEVDASNVYAQWGFIEGASGFYQIVNRGSGDAVSLPIYKTTTAGVYEIGGEKYRLAEVDLSKADIREEKGVKYDYTGFYYGGPADGISQSFQITPASALLSNVAVQFNKDSVLVLGKTEDAPVWYLEGGDKTETWGAEIPGLPQLKRVKGYKIYTTDKDDKKYYVHNNGATNKPVYVITKEDSGKAAAEFKFQTQADNAYLFVQGANKATINLNLNVPTIEVSDVTSERNDYFSFTKSEYSDYRTLVAEDGVLGNAKIFMENEPNRFLYENTQNIVANNGNKIAKDSLNFLGIYNADASVHNAALYVDTAYVDRKDNYRPQYMFALGVEEVAATKGTACAEAGPHFDKDGKPTTADKCVHATQGTEGYKTGRYLVSVKDSVPSIGFTKHPAVYDGKIRLAFVEAKHIKDTLVINNSAYTVEDHSKDSIKVSKDLNVATFALKIVDQATKSFVLETKNAYVRILNGVPVLDDSITDAAVFNIAATEEEATANEAIAAEGVQVIAGKGVVTVQGAAGKVITVANILGQTIANQVATSDNVTIAVPAGIVVVAVDGEATKVVVK